MNLQRRSVNVRRKTCTIVTFIEVSIAAYMLLTLRERGTDESA